MESTAHFSPLQSVEICVLAGGLGARMEKDKTRLRLGRLSLLGHVRAAAKATGLPVRVIRRDAVPRCGPLGGVYTALLTSRAENILVLPCDMPFLSAELLKSIVRNMHARKNALFVKKSGRVGFPFVLRRTALRFVKQQLTRRQFSLQELARTLDAQTITLPRRHTPGLFNINTPEDWKIARERLRDNER